MQKTAMMTPLAIFTSLTVITQLKPRMMPSMPLHCFRSTAERSILRRQKDWKRPTKEEREQIKKERQAALEAKEAEWLRRAAENPVQLIHVIAQAFYGNRTATEITPDDIDALVLGCTSREDLLGREKIDRSIIPVPGTDHVVLIYNKYEEEKWRAKRKDYVAKPLASIPEQGVELYSRCVACRISEEGELQSLQKVDYDALWKYLAN